MYNNQNFNRNDKNNSNRYSQNINKRKVKVKVKSAKKKPSKLVPSGKRRKATTDTESYHSTYGPYEKRYTVPYRYEHRKRRFNIGKYLYRLLLLLIIFLILSAVFSVLFYFNLTGTKRQDDILYQFVTSDSEKAHKVSVPFNLGFYNGCYYIPVSDLMDKLDCKITGDKNEITYISANADNFMKFKVNTSVVYINNVEYHMSSPSVLDSSNSERLYVPLEFIKNKFNNLSITHDEQNNGNITVEILDSENFIFNLRFTENLKNPGEGIEYEPIQFAADLSEYEQYFSPEDVDEYLILINSENSLSRDYIPTDLIDVVDTRKDRALQKLRLYAAKSLEAFLLEARTLGIENAENITVTSGYRSYDNQESLFEFYINERMAAATQSREEAEAEVAKTVAYPGRSEHQSGLAVDMHTMGSAVDIFGDTPAGKWLEENAHFFGFILRYPPGKTDITGISYEPWHFRYVGAYHATRMYNQDMCLEEYMEFLGK